MSNLTDALGALDLSQDLPEGEMVVDAIIISRLIHTETGKESFIISVNKSISVIIQLGLMTAADQVITDGDWSKDADEEG